jgi:hypothetical protein
VVVRPNKKALGGARYREKAQQEKRMFKQHDGSNQKMFRDRPRWLVTSLTSLLLIMVAVAVIVGPKLLSLSPTPKAHAAVDGNGDVSWYLSSGSGGYIQMINDIRTRVRSSYVYGSTEYAQANVGFFHINIFQNQDSPSASISIRMETDNLYVVGWSDPTGNYYRFPGGSAFPSASRQVDLPWGENYSALEKVGGDRLKMAMGSHNFDNAVQTLSNPKGKLTQVNRDNYKVSFSSAQNGVVASAVLTLIQGIAEAARFPHISGGIRDGWSRLTPFTIDSKSIVLENNWQVLGNNLVTGVNNQNMSPPSPPPSFDVNGVILNTLVQYGLALAIILYHPK